MRSALILIIAAMFHAAVTTVACLIGYSAWLTLTRGIRNVDLGLTGETVDLIATVYALILVAYSLLLLWHSRRLRHSSPRFAGSLRLLVHLALLSIPVYGFRLLLSDLHSLRHPPRGFPLDQP